MIGDIGCFICQTKNMAKISIRRDERDNRITNRELENESAFNFKSLLFTANRANWLSIIILRNLNSLKIKGSD